MWIIIVDACICSLSHPLFLQTYLSNASNRDGDTMSSVDFVTLHIQSQSVQWDSERKGYIQKMNTIEIVWSHKKLYCIYHSN